MPCYLYQLTNGCTAADAALGHQTRYTVASFTAMIQDAGFQVLKAHEFNRFGVAGWYVNRLIGRAAISRIQARMFGILLPIAKLVERIRPLPGLIVVVIAQKPLEPVQHTSDDA